MKLLRMLLNGSKESKEEPEGLYNEEQMDELIASVLGDNTKKLAERKEEVKLLWRQRLEARRQRIRFRKSMDSDKPAKKQKKKRK